MKPAQDEQLRAHRLRQPAAEGKHANANQMICFPSH